MDETYNKETPAANDVELRWDAFTRDDEKKAKKTFSRCFIAVFALLFAANAFSIVVDVILALCGLSDSTFVQSGLYTWGMQILAMYVVGFGLFYLISRNMHVTQRQKNGISVSEFLMFYAIGSAFLWAGNLVGNTLSSIIGLFIKYPVIDPVSELITSSSLWLTIPIAGILGPLVEEIVFRKMMIDRLSVYGDRIAIVVSAIAFGLFHGNLYQIFFAAMLGLVYGYVYTKTGNVWLTFGLHATNNLLQTLTVLLLPVEENLLIMADAATRGEEVDVALLGGYTALILGYSLVHFGIAVAGLVLFCMKRKKIFVSDRCEVLIPKERRASVVCINAGFILFAVLTLLTMALNIFAPLIPAIS